MEALTEKIYITRLFTVSNYYYPEKEIALLAIQKICADKIITLYNLSLFAGHQGHY